MFEIKFTTYEGKTTTIKVIDKAYALFNFTQVIGAVDLKQALLIDNLTGEILYEYYKGQFDILEGIIIRGL